MENLEKRFEEIKKSTFCYLKNNKKTVMKAVCGILVFAIAAFLFFSEEEADVQIINEEDKIQSVTSLEDENIKKSIYIDVEGYVEKPGVVILDEGSRVFEAIAEAGGLNKSADTRDINLAAILNDGDKLYIPSANEIISGEVSNASRIIDNGYSINNSNTNKKVNLNTASSEELQTLKGVGPAMAKKIIDYRASSGGFKNIDELKNVSGIGEKTFEKFENNITI